MDECGEILPPSGETDTEGAYRTFEAFVDFYRPTLVVASEHLEGIVDNMPEKYAEAYRPWQHALNELLIGVYLVSRKIPLPNREVFEEALKVFTLESAVRFLRDLCLSCRIQMPRDWIDRFIRNIHMLLSSLSILNQQQAALAR